MIQPMRPGPRQSSNGSARPSINGDHQAVVPISGRARESTVGGIQGVWTPSETRLAPDSTRWIGGSSGCSEGEKRDPATAAAMKRNDRVAPTSPRPTGRQGAWPQPTSARRPLDGALRRPTGRAGRRRREEDCDRPPANTVQNQLVGLKRRGGTCVIRRSQDFIPVSCAPTAQDHRER